MSWRAAAIVKGLRGGLTISEKLVLLILADYHNDETGQCDPSVERLADECLMGTRTAQRTLASLERKGYIRIERRRRWNGDNATNQYWLDCLSQPVDGEAISPTLFELEAPPPGVKLTPPGVRAVTPPGVRAVTPLIEIEPSKEPKDDQHSPDREVIVEKPGLYTRADFENRRGTSHEAYVSREEQRKDQDWLHSVDLKAELEGKPWTEEELANGQMNLRTRRLASGRGPP